jgi:hypothetical protein
MNSDWGAPVARRGELSLIVLTRAAAVRKFSALIDGECVLVSLILPDDSKSATAMQHPSVDAARIFITEMQPHTLDVVGDRDEDVTALRAFLRTAQASKPADVSLH